VGIMATKIISGSLKGSEIEIEGLWKEITGTSWMDSVGNIACINYAIRSVDDFLPIDDKVFYGKIGCLGYLVHESELAKNE
jgi:hypothetical protein